jgi:hypothetical protein
VKTWITPSLVLLTPENAPKDAYDEIKAHNIGYVTDLDQAREVMTALGMSEKEQEKRIHFAFTGDVGA